MKRAFRQDRLGTNIGRVEGKAALSAGDLKHISGHIQDILTKALERLQEFYKKAKGGALLQRNHQDSQK